MRRDKMRARFGWPRWGWSTPMLLTPMGQRRVVLYARMVRKAGKQ